VACSTCAVKAGGTNANCAAATASTTACTAASTANGVTGADNACVFTAIPEKGKPGFCAPDARKLQPEESVAALCEFTQPVRQYVKRMYDNVTLKCVPGSLSTTSSQPGSAPPS
jgi:hypothetical protein